jgi:uncharacterized transporter YbjL
MRLAYILICSGLMLAFFLGLRFMIYGISDEFGFGFIAGALIAAAVVGVGAHIEYRDRLAEHIQERVRFFGPD